MELEKFVDPLPIPPVLRPRYWDKRGVHYRVAMKQVKQRLHRDLPATTVWGYEGIYPGPTIEAKKGKPVWISWLNELPREHFLPVDKTLHGAANTPEVRTVVHLHGAEVRPESDGYPEAWFTSCFAETGPAFTRKTYCYPNAQQAATLWYHDHALGITRLNVYAGLAGFYLLRDAHEKTLCLPKGRYEIPLLIQDRSFNPDGSLFYPRQPQPPVPGVDPSITPGVLGDTILVNGKVWPYLEVEPRRYRFRVLNGSNQRFYRLRLDGGLPVYQIGTDGGFLDSPVRVEQLTLAPAERADLIVDFAGHAAERLVLRNDAPSPFPFGPPAEAETVGQVMQFRVTLPLAGRDRSRIPEPSFSPISRIPEESALVRRDLAVVVRRDEFGRLLFLLNGMMWHDPVTEKPRLGAAEIWNLINPGAGAHPIHVHLVQFLILDRRPFDAQLYNQTGELRYTGPAVPPDPSERGWKDTVRSNGSEVTRIIAVFKPFTGRYVWHCHLLEHEDYDMMRPFEVVAEEEEGVSP